MQATSLAALVRHIRVARRKVETLGSFPQSTVWQCRDSLDGNLPFLFLPVARTWWLRLFKRASGSDVCAIAVLYAIAL